MRYAMLSILAMGLIPLMAQPAEAGDRHRHSRSGVDVRHSRGGIDVSVGFRISDHSRHTSVRYTYSAPVYREPYCAPVVRPPVVYYPPPVVVYPAPTVVYPAPTYHYYRAPSGSCYTPTYHRSEVSGYYRFSR